MAPTASGGTGGGDTLTDAFPNTEPSEARMNTSPTETPVTSPESSTDATDAFADDHENTAPVTGWPFVSVALADNRSVSPTDSSTRDGLSATSPGICATITVALPVTVPDEAVITVEPLPTAVTRPDASTAATEGSPLDHVTTAWGMSHPRWSLTSADSRAVSPTALSSSVSGLTATDACRAGGSGAVPDSQDSVARTARATANAAIRLLCRGNPRWPSFEDITSTCPRRTTAHIQYLPGGLFQPDTRHRGDAFAS